LKKLLRIILIPLIYLLGAPGARLAARKAYRPAPQRPRILLVRPGNLGDLVMTTPVLHALKVQVPDAHITMMVAPGPSEVVTRHPDVNQFLLFSFPSSRATAKQVLRTYTLLLRTAKQLRSGDYDIAISLRPQFWWGAALLYLARIPCRIGFAFDPGTQFLTTAVPFHPLDHSTASCLRLINAGLQRLKCQPLAEPYTPERYPLQFIPTTEEQQWVNERLCAEDINPSTKLVIIHPGTGAKVKLWRADAWAYCATALMSSLGGTCPVRIILTGTKNEQPLLDEIARGTTAPTTLVTDATIGQLAALLRRAQLVLGVDSGPLHLAIAQGTPTVQIFGPTDPHNYGPWGREGQHAVVVSTHCCSTCPRIPCGRLQFAPRELAAHPCVRFVTEEEVLNMVSKLMADTAHIPRFNGQF
jgi:ADP-heptose:LPS heptosyltransferase